MTAEIQTTPAAHAGELLQRGAERVPGSPQGGWRGFVRRTVLRAMRPYTHHQREVAFGRRRSTSPNATPSRSSGWRS
jgi:hypothetical protein